MEIRALSLAIIWIQVDRVAVNFCNFVFGSKHQMFLSTLACCKNISELRRFNKSITEFKTVQI